MKAVLVRTVMISIGQFLSVRRWRSVRSDRLIRFLDHSHCRRVSVVDFDSVYSWNIFESSTARVYMPV